MELRRKRFWAGMAPAIFLIAAGGFGLLGDSLGLLSSKHAHKTAISQQIAGVIMVPFVLLLTWLFNAKKPQG